MRKLYCSIEELTLHML